MTAVFMEPDLAELEVQAVLIGGRDLRLTTWDDKYHKWSDDSQLTFAQGDWAA